MSHATQELMGLPVSSGSNRVTIRLAGLTYIVASAGFLAVFAWLATHFGYPDVLDAPAHDVLPALLALGDTGRLVWAVYAVLPLLLIPAVVGGSRALHDASGSAARHGTITLAIALQAVSSLCMTLGLARWSSAQWSLAEAYVHATREQQTTLASVSDALNQLLGTAIGEWTGELTVYGGFVALGMALHRRGARMIGALAFVTAAAGWVGMFRQVTHAVDAVAALSNGLLPAFLITYGVWLLRHASRPTCGATAPAST